MFRWSEFFIDIGETIQGIGELSIQTGDWYLERGIQHKQNFQNATSAKSNISLPGNFSTDLNLCYNPFTPKNDRCQISPAASPEILHHTVWRTWLFITYSDQRWFDYTTNSHLHIWEGKGAAVFVFFRLIASWDQFTTIPRLLEGGCIARTVQLVAGDLQVKIWSENDLVNRRWSYSKTP